VYTLCCGQWRLLEGYNSLKLRSFNEYEASWQAFFYLFYAL